MFKALSRYMKQRRALRNNCGLAQHIPILAEIRFDWLQSKGIKGIILDLDNTIISEDDVYLSPGAIRWIDSTQSIGLKCILLSNGSRRQRAIIWSERLKLPLINPARKPLPHAFKQAFRWMKLPPHQVVVIGDSLHTDILGAWWVGCPSIQVSSLPHPPRWWEKLMGWAIQISYPQDRQLRKFTGSLESEK